MSIPQCPYVEHEPSDYQNVYPVDLKVLFGGHEVMGQGWLCEECAKEFFIVQSFNEKKKKQKRVTFNGTRKNKKSASDEHRSI